MSPRKWTRNQAWDPKDDDMMQSKEGKELEKALEALAARVDRVSLGEKLWYRLEVQGLEHRLSAHTKRIAKLEDWQDRGFWGRLKWLVFGK